MSEDPFRCVHCNIKLLDADTLDKHYYDVHNAPFKCWYCPASFSRYNATIVHDRQMHKGVARVYCLVCWGAFEGKDQLQAHREAEHVNETRQLRCLHCGFIASTQNILQRHFQHCHNHLSTSGSDVELSPDETRQTLAHPSFSPRGRAQKSSHEAPILSKLSVAPRRSTPLLPDPRTEPLASPATHTAVAQIVEHLPALKSPPLAPRAAGLAEQNVPQLAGMVSTQSMLKLAQSTVTIVASPPAMEPAIKRRKRASEAASSADEREKRTPSKHEDSPKKTITQYMCKLCPFVTVHKGSFRRHICRVHKVSEPMWQDFHTVRVIPLDNEEFSDNAASETIGIGVQADMLCPECQQKSALITSLKKQIDKYETQFNIIKQAVQKMKQSPTENSKKKKTG